MNQPRRILSIDGGGIRGLIPALLLESLERATGKPARDAFDFVAGTSTGAILAGGVAAGFSGSQLATLYRRRGPELFRQMPVLGVLKRIMTGQLYDVARLRAMLAEELGDKAGWRINDVPTDIMITAKALDDGHPWYFVKDRTGANAGRTGSCALVDSLTASAAAPTYFAPWPVEGIGLLVDGGTGVAGNPVYQACVEAFEYTGAYRPEDTIVVFAWDRALPRSAAAELALAVGPMGPERASPLTWRAADRAGGTALPRGSLLPDRRALAPRHPARRDGLHARRARADRPGPREVD